MIQYRNKSHRIFYNLLTNRDDFGHHPHDAVHLAASLAFHRTGSHQQRAQIYPRAGAFFQPSLLSGSNTNSNTRFHHEAVLFYEYAITLGREIQLFWRSPFTGATGLFFGNRYLTLSYNVYNVVADHVTSFGDDSSVAVSITTLLCPRFSYSAMMGL